MAVLPAGVVEHLDVVEDIGSGLIAGGVDPASDAFALEQLEGASGPRFASVVPQLAEVFLHQVGGVEPFVDTQ